MSGAERIPEAPDYEQFTEIVVNGKQEVNTAVQKKMPASAPIPTQCYLDEIYAYLKAQVDASSLAADRPSMRTKPPEAAEAGTPGMGN